MGAQTPDGDYIEGGKKHLWISSSNVLWFELCTVSNRGDGITVLTKVVLKRKDHNGDHQFELLIDSPEKLQKDWAINRLIPILNSN